ncbi:DUF6456 domain-containing protein [Methylosinus sp. Sm6]|uniref:DUF6456 domain-containing protein n=1 Tax=Methylosinus sp. Sm6 TaxID=2866948 RepID=UPI001C995A57|nr:DUF6456 domain-containing protein [Methylosinus sp. Sm6]MBY6241675.1 DUF6456 domain-containing protein [Methylosinus sp. Sm6]
MTQRQRFASNTLDRVTRRLLEALDEPGARALRGQIDESAIVVVAPRKGVTVVRASLPLGAADSAVAQGLARWEGEGEARRLAIAPEGRAALRRDAAPAEVDPLRAQHSPLARQRIEQGAALALVNEGESPLAWLARRKGRDGRPFVAPEQVEAGERFRRDVTQAQLLQRVTANWEAPAARGRGGGGAPVADVALDARRRLARAFDAVGPDLAGLLLDVCGYLKGLELVESERGWPHRSAKVVLKIALERLALHYGLCGEARGPEQARRLLHWGAEDFRPQI